MAKVLQAADVQALLAKVVQTSLTIAGATNASPSVVNITGHGLVVGDIVLISGTTGNTALNGLRTVGTVPDSAHVTLKDFVAGTAIAGNGTTGGTIVCTRITSGLTPGDLDDLKAALDKMSSALGPFSDVNRAAESTIKTIVGV